MDAYNHDLAVKRRAEKEGMEKKAILIAEKLKTMGLCDEEIAETVELPLEVVQNLFQEDL